MKSRRTARQFAHGPGLLCFISSTQMELTMQRINITVLGKTMYDMEKESDCELKSKVEDNT